MATIYRECEFKFKSESSWQMLRGKKENSQLDVLVHVSPTEQMLHRHVALGEAPPPRR